MEQILKFLLSIHPMSDDLIAYLTENVHSRQILKKEYLLKAGQVSHHIYFLTLGLVRCFYLKNDVEISNWFMKEGDVIVSVESFYKQVKSHESIQALENCELHFLEYNQLQYIYKNFPEFNFIGRVLTEKYYALSEERLYSLRMQRSPEKYAYILQHHPELIRRVSSRHLASYLGISEETLSRIRGNQ